MLHYMHTRMCSGCLSFMQNIISHVGPDLGGEFPVLDTESNKSGVLQVCMDGIGLLLDKTKVSTCTYITTE